MSFASLTCQHGHRHEAAHCDTADCRMCCTELRECDVAKFVRHLVSNDKRVAEARTATGLA